MNLKYHLLFWLIAIVVFLGFVALFNAILLPFVLGAAIAYLLNPVVEKITAKNVGRTQSVFLILGTFLIVIGIIMAISLPILTREFIGFMNDFPTYLDQLWIKIRPYQVWVQDLLGRGFSDQIQTALQENMGKALKVGQGVASHIMSGTAAVAEFLMVLLLTPITAFYMMKEWPRITKWIYDLVPRDQLKTVKGLLHEIDGKIAGFIRGQITVCTMLGFGYAIALSLAGLNYGFVIGIGTGLLSIIPYVGSTVGLVTSLIVAWLQSDGDLVYTGIIAIIFFAGQFIEGNFITPKLMGEKVGIHPLWVIFALMAGGALFGLVGMLLAIPVAAIIGVLMGFAIRTYKKSPYYRDSGSAPVV